MVVVVVVVVGATVALTLTTNLNVFDVPTALVAVTVPTKDVADVCGGKVNVGEASVDVDTVAPGTLQDQLVGLFWLRADNSTRPVVISF